MPNSDGLNASCQRASGLFALITRQQIEQALSSDPSTAPRWQPVLEKCAAVVESLDANVLDADEHQLLASPWGAFADSDVAFATWRIEHLAVLLARLGIAALPSPPHAADEQAVLGSIPLLAASADVEALVTAIDDKTWSQCVAHHALWKWRLDAEWGHRRGQRAPGQDDFKQFISSRVERMPASVGAKMTAKGYDLEVDATPVASLSQTALTHIRCVHHERASAFAWTPPGE